MTGLISYGNTTPPAHLPVAKDYPDALVDDLPKYLLAPEVSALLHFMPDLRRKMLFTTLWNTGARISEALALTRGDFYAALAVPVCAAGHAQAARGKGGSSRRTPACRRGALPPGAVVRRAVR